MLDIDRQVGLRPAPSPADVTSRINKLIKEAQLSQLFALKLQKVVLSAVAKTTLGMHTLVSWACSRLIIG